MSTPTGEQFCRFLAAFIEVHHMCDAQHKGVLAYDTIVHGSKKLKKALTFRYEHFHLSEHWKARADGIFDGFLDEGMITRQKKRSREPAGIIVMRRVIQALYQEAILEGTRGWNTTLNDIASIVLLTALGVRAGDIMGDTKDTRPDLPGLRYADIQIHVTGDGLLKARFCIRSAKGHN